VRYVALLRGINVGGTNKVAMTELKAVFEAAGMADVRTYINSGNVLFSTALRGRAKTTLLLERAIRERVGFDVGLILRDAKELRSVVEAMPAHWRNDDSMKCDVLFLWKDVDRPAILEELSFRPEMEHVIYTPGAVIWGIDRKNVTRSRLPRIVGTPLYKRMTIRNCNTARKLLELIEE